MLAEPVFTDTPPPSATAVILPWLDAENDVIRCAAVRALARQQGEDDMRRQAFITLLRDPDPDIRTDAMEALAPLARPEDAQVIRASLEGDPVREVKLMAIQCLARLRDADSLDLFRALIADRAEPRVAWEDETGDWDDWLDIQIAVIDALGEMGDIASAQKMLDALDDDMGQTLDIPVFRALSRMGSEGVAWLLAIIQTGQRLAPKRATRILADAAPDALMDHLDTLLTADDADIRRLAVRCLSATDPAAQTLTLHDPSDAVRAEALAVFGPQKPDWTIIGLTDRSERVQARALDGLTLPLEPDLHDDLVKNMLSWLDTAGADLGEVCAAQLPKLAPNRAGAALARVAGNPTRPIRVRLAALAAMCTAKDPSLLDQLHALLADRSQQIRLAALQGVKTCAAQGDIAALDLLTAAIDQSLLTADEAVQPAPLEDGADVALPKGQRSGPIRISEDGDIVDTQEDNQGNSTLLAITGQQQRKATTAKDAKKRRRVSVDGPDAIAAPLARSAMGICGDLNAVTLYAAATSYLLDRDDEIRLAAWQMMHRHAPHALELLQAAIPGIQADTPELRRLAFATMRGATRSRDDLEPYIHAALQDSDAVIRSEAVAALQGADALDFISDPAGTVRHMALQRGLEADEAATRERAIELAFASERVDTIAYGLRISKEMRDATVAHLKTAPTDRAGFLLLEALAAT